MGVPAMAFCLMLLNKGSHENGRILSRPSVELMTTDHITPEQKKVSEFVPGFWDNRGWGFGLSIMTRRDDLAGTPGRFGWDGGYGTSAYTDPREEMVAILMTQRLMDSPSAPDLYSDFWTSVYQATTTEPSHRPAGQMVLMWDDRAAAPAPALSDISRWKLLLDSHLT
jgi:CubicO group peptidase (beta-lactamase class C family)